MLGDSEQIIIICRWQLTEPFKKHRECYKMKGTAQRPSCYQVITEMDCYACSAEVLKDLMFPLGYVKQE